MKIITKHSLSSNLQMKHWTRGIMRWSLGGCLCQLWTDFIRTRKLSIRQESCFFFWFSLLCFQCFVFFNNLSIRFLCLVVFVLCCYALHQAGIFCLVFFALLPCLCFPFCSSSDLLFSNIWLMLTIMNRFHQAGLFVVVSQEQISQRLDSVSIHVCVVWC